VPAWAKDLKIGGRMINARAENLTTSNAYKGAFRRHRAILPADGFYEWRKLPDSKRKQPYYIERRDGEPIALAGLWEEWRGPDRKGEPLRTSTIITTTPNETMAPIHDRHAGHPPPPRGTPGSTPPTTTSRRSASCSCRRQPNCLTAHPVSSAVNSVRNDGPDLIVETTGDQLVS
jgi:putative SOS response-associated peptidase YedK